MNRFPVTLIVALGLSSMVLAEDPVGSVEFQNGSSFAVESSPRMHIYGLSERAKPVMRAHRSRIIAADYATGTVIRTADPQLAIQELCGQLAAQAELSLGRVTNSAMGSIAPSFLIMAFDEKSVWHLLLTPRDEAETYMLSVSCLIDE